MHDELYIIDILMHAPCLKGVIGSGKDPVGHLVLFTEPPYGIRLDPGIVIPEVHQAVAFLSLEKGLLQRGKEELSGLYVILFGIYGRYDSTYAL